MDVEQGDKIRIKVTEHEGKRGVVESVHAGSFIVRLNEADEFVHLTAEDVTNYSLAARKAWQKMPNRRVGRPKGATTTDRVSVTLRINRDLWVQIQNAEATGQLNDRVAFINKWISQGLIDLTTKRKKEP
jgi:hypothetical protein